MKTPAFWQHKNILSHLLLPASWLYDVLSKAKRQRIQSAALPVPVICVGNLTAGGAGKTPVALALAEALKPHYPGAFFLSKGYGGRIKAPTRVDPCRHTARDVGDEPLLLTGTLPTVIAHDRMAGAQFAISQGATLILMDDGFQNPAIRKDFSLLVIDAKTGFGNGRILPAGPLRESPAEGFARAQAIVMLNVPNALPPLPSDLPVFSAAASIAAPEEHYRAKRYVAFSGIAYPQKFFDTLGALGADVVKTIPYPDHYLYTHRDIAELQDTAREYQTTLITTAKDAVRLPPEIRNQVEVLPITIVFNDKERLLALIDSAIRR